jgi:hypothetical protein
LRLRNWVSVGRTVCHLIQEIGRFSRLARARGKTIG